MATETFLLLFLAFVLKRVKAPFPLDCAEIARIEFVETNGIFSVYPIDCQNSNCAKQIFCDFQDGEGGYTVGEIY